MINQFNKNSKICLRKRNSDNVDLLRSNICIDSASLLSCPSGSGHFASMSKFTDEKFEKKNFMDDKTPAQLDIVLWNRAKTKKLVNVSCNSNGKRALMPLSQNCARNLNGNQTFAKMKEVSNIKIKIYECPLGEKSFKFFFETLDSSEVTSKVVDDGNELKWKGGKDSFNFKINLNQNLTNKNWGKQNPPKICEKENVFNSLFQPTKGKIYNPSPKSNYLIFLFF